MQQSNKYHISAHCTVRQGQVFKNGALFFEDARAPSLKDFQEGLVLLQDAPGIREYRPEEVGVVLSNAHASLDTDIRYLQSVQDMASPALFVYTLPNIMIGEICIRHKFKGENTFFVFKDFDATFITSYVKGLLDEGLVRACVYGWVDVLHQEYDAELYLIEVNHQ
jgi:hypothetical protein